MTKALPISLGINVLLAAAFVQVYTHTNFSVNPVAPAPRLEEMPAAAKVSDQLSPVVPVKVGSGWQTWIEPLRAAHVPARVLAGLVQADFEERWQKRQTDLQKKYMRGEIDADGLAAAGLEHDTALEHEQEEALGPSAYHDWDRQRVLQGMNIDSAHLSDSEKNAVYTLERNLQSQTRVVQLDKLRGKIDQATSDQQQQNAEKELTDKLRALLGDARAARLQGADDTLGNLKRAFPGSTLTPAQLDQLAQAQRSWDRTRSTLTTEEVNSDDPRYENEIRANDRTWRARFEEIAGPAAFDQYTKSQDSRYTDLMHNANRWGLGAAQAEQVFGQIKAYEEAVQQYTLETDARGVDLAVRNHALQQFRTQSAQALEASLGPAKYDELAANGLGLKPLVDSP